VIESPPNGRRRAALMFGSMSCAGIAFLGQAWISNEAERSVPEQRCHSEP
jgi:hypothetical protein